MEWNFLAQKQATPRERVEVPLLQDKPCFNNHVENMSSFLNRQLCLWFYFILLFFFFWVD